MSEALRVVLRGFVVLPLFAQGQHYAVYLFFTTGGGGRWVSLTYHALVRELSGLHGQECMGPNKHWMVRDIVIRSISVASMS